MANNYRHRNNLGQFIALDDSSSSSSSEESLNLDNLQEEYEINLDPINNFENLIIDNKQLQAQLIQPPIMSFNSNPYCSDINPSMNEGLKLFLKATEERKAENRIKISQSNAKTIMTALQTDARKFGWGPLVNIVPINEDGDTKSLIKQYNEVTLLDVKRQARITWGDRTAAYIYI